MIGISLNGYGSINIGYLPDRESIAFYVVRKGRIVATAYFRSEDDAWEAARMLRVLADVPSFEAKIDRHYAIPPTSKPKTREASDAETDRG